ncbi:MAG: hypothetical protein ABJA83_11080 [Burkholderiaceae bacterium]
MLPSFSTSVRAWGEPHDYGVIDGERRLLFYQIGGESDSGKPVRWRRPSVSKISQLQVSTAGLSTSSRDADADRAWRQA